MTGEPSWIEIGVPGGERATAFWAQLLGWRMHDMPGPNAWFETPTISGGLHGNDPDPAITVYFAVSDIDAAVQQVRELGGTAGEPSPEQQDFGRFASCTSDQGVRFGLHQPPR